VIVGFGADRPVVVVDARGSARTNLGLDVLPAHFSRLLIAAGSTRARPRYRAPTRAAGSSDPASRNTSAAPRR
jgi:hypothetical protein